MSISFGYTESGNEVTEGVISLKLILIKLELVEIAAAAVEVNVAAEALSDVAQGSGVSESYKAG